MGKRGVGNNVGTSTGGIVGRPPRYTPPNYFEDAEEILGDIEEPEDTEENKRRAEEDYQKHLNGD